MRRRVVEVLLPEAASLLLTTLDGGVAKGYVEIAQVDHAIAVHFCL